MSNGRVYLIGAGPGDPELMTLRAARAARSISSTGKTSSGWRKSACWIAVTQGGMDAAAAKRYFGDLARAGRYQRDVY